MRRVATISSGAARSAASACACSTSFASPRRVCQLPREIAAATPIAAAIQARINFERGIDVNAIIPGRMRIVIVIALIGILFSLGSALFYLMRDKGTTNRTVNALTIRVGISIALFLFILFSYWMGWIEPRSY